MSRIGWGKLAGKCVNTFCNATGPPVDVPIAINLYCLPEALGLSDVPVFLVSVTDVRCENERSGWRSDEVVVLSEAVRDPVEGVAATLEERKPLMRRRPISRTFCCNTLVASSLSRAISSNFFGRKSNAPASSASKVALAPS